MRKTTFILFVFSLFSCLFFSSCSSFNFIQPVATLLNPPLYYPEYEDLVGAFERDVKTDNQFCIPYEGDFSSAIIVDNIDSDNDDEALIFYKNKNEKFAKLHYFEFINDEWVTVGDYNGYGNNVKSLSVNDLDNDGIGELIVIWETSGVQTGDVMSVYRKKAAENSYREIANEPCLISKIFDVDSDGFEDIFYICQISSGASSQKVAKALKFSGDSVVIMGETKLDSNISSYVSVKTEKESENSPLKIYADALKGEKQMITELIYWDAEKSQLIAPWLDKETLTNSITLRHEPVECTDINNDGKIDIPIQILFTAEDEIKEPIGNERLYLTVWMNFNDGNAKVVSNTLINLSDGYYIKLTEEEVNSIGVRVYNQKNCWVIYLKNDYKNTEEAIFSVIRIDRKTWETENFESYISISENNEGVVCVYITETGKNLGITEKTIRNKIFNFS